MTQFRKNFSHSRADITRAFSEAKPVFSGGGIKVLHAPCGLEESSGKLLVVIPRTSGKACERNRFRRRAKSLFYEEKWHTLNGFWIVIAYQRALALDFDALKSLLQKIFVSVDKEFSE